MKTYAHKPLPSDHELFRQYMRPGANFTTLSEKYGWHPSVISDHVKAAALAQQLAWPLKPLAERNARRDSVPVALSRSTLRDLKSRYSLSYVTIAKHLKLNVSTVRKIAGVTSKTVERATQTRILEFATRLDLHELVLPPEPVRGLNRPVCPSGHAYTSYRDKRGNRVCVTCRANKARRSYPANTERRLRIAAEKKQAA